MFAAPTLFSASMGPRSFDRGNETALLTSGADIALQWGRDLLIAEMPPEAEIMQLFAALQWGRDLLIAEMVLQMRLPCKAI